MSLCVFVGQLLLTLAGLSMIAMEATGKLPQYLPWERGLRTNQASPEEIWLAMALMAAIAGAILLAMAVMRG